MNFLQKIKLFPYAMKGYLFSSPEKNGEYKFLNQIFSNLSEDKLVFDVGANVGNYSSKILEITKNVKIHCFEPVPRTFSRITQKLSEVKNVYLNNVAMSDKEGKTNMYEYGELSGVNSLEYHPNVNQKNTKIIEIETRTLDEYCLENKIDDIYFMKIDVEGHEINTLKGAAKMIKEKNIKMIQFEYNYLWKNTGNKLEDAFLLLKHNYDLFRLTPWGKIRIGKFKKKLENFPHGANYIAIRKNNANK